MTRKTLGYHVGGNADGAFVRFVDGFPLPGSNLPIVVEFRFRTRIDEEPGVEVITGTTPHGELSLDGARYLFHALQGWLIAQGLEPSELLPFRPRQRRTKTGA